jgi:predicted glycosyltransferase
MRVLIDIGHPAHVHFFREPIRQLSRAAHEIIVTSRRKEIATDLLDALDIEHVTLSAQGRGGMLGLARELLHRNTALLRLVSRRKPDVMAAIGGIFIAQVGTLTRVPSAVFYDTENARLQNLLTYPLASRIIVPRAYQGWTPPKRVFRYDGYHELSYLRPDRFRPDRERAVRNGLDPTRRNFLVRVVSWQASHDVGEHGWSDTLLSRVVDRLAEHGSVMISSERPLPDALLRHAYPGRIEDIHHVMAHLDGFVGESATMASEAAVLGVPAVYAAETGRGYTDEQESRYGLVHNVRRMSESALDEAVDWALTLSVEEREQRRATLLGDTIDVATMATEQILSVGEGRRRHGQL